MLLDFFFPKTCLGCKKIGKYLCTPCVEEFEYILKDACTKCDRVNTHGFIHENCKEANSIDGSLSVLYYNNTIKKVIRNIKYKLVRNACKEFFGSISQNHITKFSHFSNNVANCYLQPIPLHAKRYRERGFNQADIIAKWFESITDMPTIDVLKRVKYTNPQARTENKIERIKNVENAFKVTRREWVRGKKIILVDDVITTGNTTKEAARVLKQAGAYNVFVFSIAHG